MATLVTFATVPTQYAPKRKVLEFAKPKWHNKLGEFNDPDVISWIVNTYQDKAYPTREAFNKAYDYALDMGLMPSKIVGWHNRTMVLTKDDVTNFAEVCDGGGFDGSQTAAEKVLKKMQAALETGEKVIFVY